jgi:hypothetical protein
MNHSRIDESGDDFRFVVMAERKGGARAGVFETAVEKVNLLQPDFVMSVGSYISGNITEESMIDKQWDEFLSSINPLEVPFFPVPGRHEISNNVMAAKWQERFGSPYYYFLHKDVLFLCLNTQDPPVASIGEEQVQFAREILSNNADVRWTFVFMHDPLWTMPSPNGWEEIEPLLEGRKHTVFAGYTHEYTKYERNGQAYIVMATTGGISRLRGPLYGEFDHVMMVTMTDEVPRFANLMIDGIHDENIRTERTAGLVKPVLQHRAIVSQPILVPEKVASPVKATISLVNESNIPMNVWGSIVEERDETLAGQTVSLVPAPATVGVEVPADSEQSIEIDLSFAGEGTVSVDNLIPLTFRWNVSYAPEGETKVTLEGQNQVMPETVYPCPGRSETVKVDGRLNEWSSLPRACENPRQFKLDYSAWKGPQDASFRFGTAFDERYLYIAVDVTDDAIFVQPDTYPWHMDAVEVRFDARTAPARSQNRGEVEFEDFLLFALSPGKTPAETIRFKAEFFPDGVKTTCVETDKGYSAEIAVPLSYIIDRQGKSWDGFRLNVAVDDRDEPGGPRTMIWWRPDWRSPVTFAGSGTFKRIE